MGTDIQDLIAAERRELAGILDGLSESQWDSATLCASWRVREVVAHMTMPFRYSIPRLIRGMLSARGNFNRMADRAARQDTVALSAEQLATCLRDNVNHPWKPPGGGLQGALSHDVIHGMDITVALGMDRQVPDERLDVVLEGVTPKHLKYFGVDLSGIRLKATDRDFSFGSGADLRGRAQDLLLVLCGRRLPPGLLEGAAAERFTGRADPAGHGRTNSER